MHSAVAQYKFTGILFKLLQQHHYTMMAQCGSFHPIHPTIKGGVGGATATGGIGGTISSKTVSPEIAEKLLNEWYQTNISK